MEFLKEQLPPDMNIRRKQLLPIMHRLRRDGNRAQLVRDRLIVNGKLYEPSDEEECDFVNMCVSEPTQGDKV
jgi:hypothetical protein